MSEFRLDLTERGRADVYLACAGWDRTIAAVVKKMDDAQIRVVGNIDCIPTNPERTRRILRSCSGIICDADQTNLLLNQAVDRVVPVLERDGAEFRLHASTSQDLSQPFWSIVLRFQNMLFI
jgi:hypothetical protein